MGILGNAGLYLDTVVVQAHTESDSRVEHLLGLLGGVDIQYFFTLHEALLMIQNSLDDAITNSLSNNVLGTLLALEAKTDADVAERDTRVRQAHHADSGLDHVLAETENEGVGAVPAEGFRVRIEGLKESVELSNTHRTHKEEVGIECLL